VLTLSINGEIYEDLKNKIISLELKPGQPLNEINLANHYGASRTPIREAMKKLEKFKLVNILPRVGTYVSQIDLKEFKDIFEIRVALEGLIGELAVQRISLEKREELKDLICKVPEIRKNHDNIKFIQIDQDFHKILRVSSMNAELSELLENYDVRSVRLWSYTIGKAPIVESYLNDYEEFFNCIEDKDSSKGKKVMENHVKATVDYIRDKII
jgi:GntR family transcriptional regulator, rspAB operon transcriptional repressor